MTTFGEARNHENARDYLDAARAYAEDGFTTMNEGDFTPSTDFR